VHQQIDEAEIGHKTHFDLEILIFLSCFVCMLSLSFAGTQEPIGILVIGKSAQNILID